MDRMSMAHGLEARSPFLDPALVEFGASLPDHLRMRFGIGKRLLRRAMKGILPESIFARGKMGFGAPLGACFRGDRVPLSESGCSRREARSASTSVQRRWRA